MAGIGVNVITKIGFAGINLAKPSFGMKSAKELSFVVFKDYIVQSSLYQKRAWLS